MCIDDKIREVATEWEKSKVESQNLLVVLGKLCELNKAVIELLRKQGIPYSEASIIIAQDIEKYRTLLSQSVTDFLEVEDEYKRLLHAKVGA